MSFRSGNLSNHTLLQCFNTRYLCAATDNCVLKFFQCATKSKNVGKSMQNSYISIKFWFFLRLGVPTNFFSKLVCRMLKKVENHCSFNYPPFDIFCHWLAEKIPQEHQPSRWCLGISSSLCIKLIELCDLKGIFIDFAMVG